MQSFFVNYFYPIFSPDTAVLLMHKTIMPEINYVADDDILMKLLIIFMFL